MMGSGSDANDARDPRVLGGAIDPSTRGYLESFASDPEPIIAESCEVALEIMRREREGEIVTADGAVVAVKRD